MTDMRKSFEAAWAKRPWITETESDKDRAWRWWQAALAHPAPQDERWTAWRHKKRGTTYNIVGVAEVQAEDPLTEAEITVVYRCREDGSLWVRRKSEFYDGRFEELAAQAPAPGGHESQAKEPEASGGLCADASHAVRVGEVARTTTVVVGDTSAEGTLTPVAWIAFAGNGNVRFWTSDAERANAEKQRGMDLRGFTLAELVALTAVRSPAGNAAVWHPIETAPKDGTKIDLLYPYPRGRTIDCFWRQDEVTGPDGGWFWLTPKWQSQPGLGIDWHLLPESEWTWNTYPNMQPTHWMPAVTLPVSPATEKADV